MAAQSRCLLLLKMAAFSSNENRCMEQIIVDINRDRNLKPVEYFYEISKCVQWIEKNDFKKVCLQFPDELLVDSAVVSLAIKENVNSQIYILGDSTYGSCCVDELSADHVEGDAIIHFGHACLSPTKRLPVLYIFPINEINSEHFVSLFLKEFCESEKYVQLIFDVAYEHSSDCIYKQVSEIYNGVEVAKLALASESQESEEIIRLGRKIAVPKQRKLTDVTFIFIGEDNRTLSNFLLELPGCEFYHYDPTKEKYGLRHLHQRDSKFLMKRMYLVERVKDAATLGVLIGTLGVVNYLDAVERVRKLAASCGKRVYIIAVGRPNVPKLANFPEIDVFVHVACPESILLDSREFYQPIVSMYEVELACNPKRQTKFEYVSDFRRFLQGEDSDIASNEEQSADVSLVTGKIRSLATDNEPVPAAGSSSALTRRPDLVVSVGAGGDFLASRSWRGLEPNLGETPVQLAVEGRSGIAAGYDAEPQTN